MCEYVIEEKKRLLVDIQDQIKRIIKHYNLTDLEIYDASKEIADFILTSCDLRLFECDNKETNSSQLLLF
jgi:hypothetical protein